jgi:hypothetical protein
MSSARCRPVAASFLCILAAGCGPEATYPVEGVVKFRGDEKPATDLAGGAVVFTSMDLKESSKGIIGSDGTFRLETLDSRDGAMVRKYKVAVIPPVNDGGGNRRALDTRFASPVTSPIELEVQKGPNHFEVVVEALKGKGR